MFFVPTYKRPDRCQRLLDSISSASPSTGMVIVHGHDFSYDQLRLPPKWGMTYIERKRPGCCEPFEWAFHTYRNLDWYGIIDDDMIVRSESFQEPLVAAAGFWGLSHSNDGSGRQRMHGAVVYGGDLVRTVGWWAPPGLQHAYFDDAWEKIGAGLNNRVRLADVMVEHMHWAYGKADVDEAYNSKPDIHADYRVWQQIEHSEVENAIRKVRKARSCQ